MFILVLVMGAMAEISVSIFQSYNKSRAIKTVSEDVGFAMNSIAKDVRMGSIDSTSACISSNINDKNNCIVLSRNSDGKKICYKIETGNKILRLYEGTNSSCGIISGTTTKDIVDLTSASMSFSADSGFYNMATSKDTVPSPNKIRGWVEMNFNIAPTGGAGMDKDQINVQTIVSSRDYGWEEVPGS